MMRLLQDLKTAAAIAGGIVATAFGVYWLGRRDQAEKERFDELEQYQKDRKRIDGAETFYGDDPAIADRFLHERADKRDL